MKTKLLFSFSLVVLTLLIFSSLPQIRIIALVAATPPATQAAGPLVVQVVDQKDAKTTLTNPRLRRDYTCGSFIYYEGVPKETSIALDGLPFVVGETGETEYIIYIPLGIIKSLAAQGAVVTPKPGEFLKQLYKIILADGSTVEGNLYGGIIMSGDAELGSFQIDPARIKEITGVQSIQDNFVATSQGQQQGILIMSDDTQLKLDKVDFYSRSSNKNGCITGDVHSNTLSFKTGESQYDVGWDKIKTFVFKPRSKDDREFGSPLTLVTQSGSEIPGRAFSLGVAGIVNVGNYKLRVEIPFDSKAKRLTVGQ
ncbi:MAG: hypothetical protein IT324_30400 [Anaerolineae bacterium]|nr:hypothetical protein [Anaerolineae bacterium]